METGGVDRCLVRVCHNLPGVFWHVFWTNVRAVGFDPVDHGLFPSRPIVTDIYETEREGRGRKHCVFMIEGVGEADEKSSGG